MSLLSPQLEAFSAIVKHRTVHSAARELGITQTGVTQRIRALEQTLSTTLFIRSRTGMGLTEEGQALFRYCQGARDLEGQALAQIHKAGVLSQIQIRITGPTSIMRSRIIPACLPIMKEWKNLLLNFQINDESKLTDELRSGVSHFVIVPPEDVAREMDSKILKAERYVLVASSKWRNRSLTEVIANERIIDFDPSDQMSFNYLRKFGLLDWAKKDRYFANSTEAICEMFCAGLGYGVLTFEFAEPWLKQGKLFALSGKRCLENHLALVWYPRPHKAPYFDTLIKTLH